MTALQKFSKKLEEEASDHERSILLVNIMHAMGFSRVEVEIHSHEVHLRNVLHNMFRTTKEWTARLTGSLADGMRGGIYANLDHSDLDCLCTYGDIKLYTPRTNNINNPPLLVQHGNEDYNTSFFLEEDDNFPGYVKLLLAEVCTPHSLIEFRTRNDIKICLSSSGMMKSIVNRCTEIPKRFGIFLKEMNGPACTFYKTNIKGRTYTGDNVFCIHYDMWPNSANLFITRRKPNNWPSSNMIEHITRLGCDIAPVGHHDSKHNDLQWRISFPGELNLLLDLTDVQILCYALIKIILKKTLNKSQREVVSSFHIKNVIFWCVELCSCQWVNSNYINCVNMCLTKLIEMIKARNIPHYIIEGRNLFNSKMTETMSMEIVDILSKFDMTHVFELYAFERVFEVTHYDNAQLKRETLNSTILACFHTCHSSFTRFSRNPTDIWRSYVPHNATISLLNYINIQQNFKKVKGMPIQYAKYLLKSMVGFLYYAKYRESNKTKCILASTRLIDKSLFLDNPCVKLRAATFFCSIQKYSRSIEICDTFLISPPRNEPSINISEWLTTGGRNVFQLFKMKTNEEIENIMKEIVSIYYRSPKLKNVLPNSKIKDTVQQNPVPIFRNLTNLYFSDLYMDVTFMTAEKWVVPDPIQYELLSLSHDAQFPCSGIHLDPLFVGLLTNFVCYQSTGNVNGMADMLTYMSRFISVAFTANTKLMDSFITTETSYVYLNMFVYCQIKTGHHRQSVKSILQSMRNFPSRYNAASGYMKVVLQILNSLLI